METWGELFWDAWIRLRLACRRLYRSYWPPNFKTWQVCTATGIVSIILTLVVLNLPTTKSELQAKNKSTTGTERKRRTPVAAISKDPFVEPDVLDSNTVMSEAGSDLPPTQEPAFDDEVETPRLRRTAIAKADFPPSEPTEEPAVASDLMEQPALEAPSQEEVDLSQSTSQAVPDTPDVTEATPTQEPFVTEEEAPAKTPAEFAAPVESEEALSATEGNPATDVNAVDAAPGLTLPERADDHYVRFGHHDENVHKQGASSPIKSKIIKDAPPPVKHTPFITPIRPKSHYSRFGHHEDSEEDRHSVRDIRPTRTDNVPIPEARVAIQAAAPMAAQQDKAVEAPVSEPVVTEPPVAKSNEELFAPEEAASNRMPEEPAAANPPPVLFAPEVEPAQPRDVEYDGPVKSTEATDHHAHQHEDSFSVPRRKLPLVPLTPETTPSKELDYHGPVKSVEPTDHDAHQAEDAFNVPRRKQPLVPDVPPAVEVPETQEVESHSPVRSTESSDHHAHQEEDAIPRPVRRAPSESDWPEAQAPSEATESSLPMNDNTGPAPEEMIDMPPEIQPEPQPQSAIEEEVVTPPVPVEETAPESTREYDAGRSEPEAAPSESEDDRVIPMAVTRPRTERITVPERIPPGSVPVDPVPAVSQEVSEFVPTMATPRPTQPPRIVMEITGPRQAPVGTQIVLHFKLKNVGTTPITGIVVTDVLPTGLQHRASSDLEYAVSRLNPGEVRETNLTVQCAAVGMITNKALLRADGDITTQAEIQFEVVNPTAASAGKLPSAPSGLAMRHHGPEHWLVDSTGQFLVTVTNKSNETLRNVVISQSLPKGTNLVHATVGNKVDPKARTVTWTIADFAPGVSYILETELHSLTSGPATSVARIKIGDTEIAEDRWTAVSYTGTAGIPPARR